MIEAASVLVGANLSEHSDEAIRQGAAWARAHGWKLVVCHVAPSPLGVHTLFPQLSERDVLAQPEVELELQRALREHVDRLTGGAASDVVIAFGSVDWQLVHEAREREARLVVVGSHSHSGLQEIFLGDVAESVVAQARSSVLVARPHRPTRRILVATNFSPDAAAALVVGGNHAQRIGAHLTVACSIEKPMRLVREMTNFGAAYGFIEDEYGALKRSAQDRLREQMESLGIEGEPLVLEGKPASAIVQAAGRVDADLVVIGASGGSGLRHILLGTVAEKVARAAPCSVLVCREPPRA